LTEISINTLKNTARYIKAFSALTAISVLADSVDLLIQLVRLCILFQGKSDQLLLLSAVGLLQFSNLLFVGWFVHLRMRMPEVLTRDIGASLFGFAKKYVAYLQDQENKLR